MMAKQSKVDEPFLSPIEEPQDPILQQIYATQEKYLGKVITSSKVHSARLPPSFAQLYGKVGELDRELTISREALMLIRALVAQINVCEFCMDANRAAVIAESMNQPKFDALDQYSSSTLFTDADRAMLDYVTELTKNKEVDPKTFDRLAKYFSERQICEIVYVVASEHLYNITNIGLNIHSDMICDLVKKRKYG
jgi:alkylhydroperoxidase family enzyme